LAGGRAGLGARGGGDAQLRQCLCNHAVVYEQEAFLATSRALSGA
jgi:hypothetical protein